ncbi:MAG: hypothetical protein GEU93_03825 [Propionibacteriales bacterium]|nr:hypothetical protein [Propionibacteriales bacterium]
MEWLLVVVVLLLAAFGVLLSWTAGRVDRLHHRVNTARSGLEAQLMHRSGAALELAAAGLLDPARSLVLLDAAHHARAREPGDREQAESDLSAALVAALGDPEEIAELQRQPGAAELFRELGDACRKVELARRFHNDVVTSTRSLRGRPLVRWFRLAGHAELPSTVELDDSWPPVLP